MNKHLLCLLLIYSLPFILIGQPENGMPSAPGKCFAKCLTTQNGKVDTTFYSYLVLNENSEELSRKSHIEKIELNPREENWIKAYKNDIVEPIWEITENNNYSKTFKYLTNKQLKKVDPNLIDTIYLEIETFSNIIEWKEVVCDTDLNVGLLDEIRSALYERGYLETFEPSSVGKDLRSKFQIHIKEALVQYQKDNNLGIGQLTKETLISLNILDPD